MTVWLPSNCPLIMRVLHNRRVQDFDPATLRAAVDDPTDFVDHDGLLVIDEIQLVPELLRPIKVSVDLDPTPG